MSVSKKLSTSSLERWLIRRLLSAIGNPPIRIALGNGAESSPPGALPQGTVFIRDRRMFLKLLLEPELYFGDGYSQGRIEIEGNLLSMLIAVYQAMTRESRPRCYPEILSRWMERRQANSLRGSRKNIHCHYDIGTDFYKLWLDSQLAYTCAYYADPSCTLEEAQVAKMDHVCRKVQLRPGDTVVEAGCGWGALALHMAKYYGASVKAFNISHDQVVYARLRARHEGMSGRVEFIEDDYRNISGKFDVFMSVGMLEHVGPERYSELGTVIHGCLRQAGRGFIHFIGRNCPKRFSLWTRKRIFPGALPPTLRQAMDIFEDGDFSILDVENLRLHYARTLQHWLERFEKSADKAALMFSPEFVRTWRLYLTGSIAAFLTGSLQLFQIAFARGTNNDIPWTRAHLYPARAEEQERVWISAMS